MARQVSKNTAALKQIEQNFKTTRHEELPPLEPMIETLRDYIKE